MTAAPPLDPGRCKWCRGPLLPFATDPEYFYCLVCDAPPIFPDSHTKRNPIGTPR